MSVTEFTDEQIARADEEGISVEELAEREGEAAPQDDGTAQLVIPGTATRLTGNAGGKRPTQATFKMKSISLPISENQQIDKDETMWVAVEVRIDSVNVQNHTKGREIIGVERVHTATPLAVQLLDGPPEGADEE